MVLIVSHGFEPFSIISIAFLFRDVL